LSFCPRCGSHLKETYAYCINCGSRTTEITKIEIEMNDLGEPMNREFKKLYQRCLLGHCSEPNKFQEKAFAFFDQNYGDHKTIDKFFNNFFPIWRRYANKHRFTDAELLWVNALSIAHEWEKTRQKLIHKGTPYYCYGATCILNRDFDKGFLLIHQALEEDKITFCTDTPQTPARCFVILDFEKQEQLLYYKVKEISYFVEQRLSTYHSSRGGKIDLPTFKSRFLEDQEIEDIVFYFVFELFLLHRWFMEFETSLTRNVLGAELQANTLFSLCLILENFLRYESKNPAPKGFGYLLAKFLCTQKKLVNLDSGRVKQLRNDFKVNFKHTAERLLDSSYRFQDGSAPSSIEEDWAIAYGFRNYGAHRLEDQPVVYENFEEICQRILNALFFSVERL